MVKFIYSEKATTFCEISTLLLSYVVPVKRKVEISQNVVAFSEYMNFTIPRVQKTRSDDNLIIQIALVLLENYGLPALPVLAL